MDGGGSDLQDSSSLGSIFNDKPTVDIHPSPGCIHLATGKMVKNLFNFTVVFEVRTLNIIICSLNITCCGLLPFPCGPGSAIQRINPYPADKY